MPDLIDTILAELRALVRALGTDGGLISPSVYDTAQVARLLPRHPDRGAALDWVLDQQQPDGGWGDPAVPLTRHVATLAALLALGAAPLPAARVAVQRGTAFFGRRAEHWVGTLPDDLPVGVELLLPRLLAEAEAAGLDVPRANYAALVALGERRRRKIAASEPRPGSPPIHSWEAWGTQPKRCLLDQSGGVGHSPAATAAWLRAASEQGGDAATLVPAEAYLSAAAGATGADIPGVVPTVWPIARFEQAFALYALVAAGLLCDPRLRDVVQPQLRDLGRAAGAQGLGMSDYFLADGDNTAVALAVLGSAGYAVERDVLRQFELETHVFAYPGEHQPSLSLTAHALHAYTLLGTVPPRIMAYVLERQQPDGRWASDKWHSSWLYATSQVLLALPPVGYERVMASAVDALLRAQRADGGWGSAGSTAEETAYAVLALRWSRRCLRLAVAEPLRRARAWLRTAYETDAAGRTGWIGKETYCPPRITRAFELAALLALVEEQGHDD